MSYPEKGAKYAGQDRAKKIASRAEGGVVQFPVSQKQSDNNRMRLHNLLSSARSKGIPERDIEAALPKPAPVLMGPGAERKRGGKT